MRRLVFLFVLLLLMQFPSAAEDTPVQEDVRLPNIFIWAIPDDEEEPVKDDKKSKKDKKNTQNEKTPEITQEETAEGIEEEPIVLNATTLKGYAEYVEGVEDILYMDDLTLLTLNIKTPQKIASQSIAGNIAPDTSRNIYALSRYKGEEYAISPLNRKFTEKDGNWSFGTSFNSEISTSQLENATSLFTKYETKYFSLSSNYKKNNPLTTQIQTDNFSITPELKFNNFFAIKDVFSTDITRNRRSSELIFSINPLGSKDTDRMRLDFGAKQTYDMNTGNTWSQLNFTTNFKL